MFLKNHGRGIALASVLIFFMANAGAQQTLYKWVDEDGVVHFSDSPPPASESANAETITTSPAPVVTPSSPAPAPTARSANTSSSSPATQAATTAPPKPQQAAIADMSLAELDTRCNAAREEKLAPERDAQIAKCKQDKREDPAFCDRFYADYGDAGRTVSGAMRPRMYDDLPECVDAMNERNRRGGR